MKSTFANMVLVLLVITAVAAAAVGYVYKLTEEPIAQAKQQKKLGALGEVLPAFDNRPTEDVLVSNDEKGEVYIYLGKENGEVKGYAVESFTNNGFSGLIKIMVGFLPDGTIKNIEVLEQAETPGLGAKLADANNPVRASFLGKSPANMKMAVKKDGGDVDAITASTISSRAYIDAVARAYRALQQEGLMEGEPDTMSGATGAAASDTTSGATSDANSGATTQN